MAPLFRSFVFCLPRWNMWKYVLLGCVQRGLATVTVYYGTMGMNSWKEICVFWRRPFVVGAMRASGRAVCCLPLRVYECIALCRAGRQASRRVALRRSLPSLCFTFTLKWHPTADRRTMQCRRGGVWSEQLPLPVWFLPLPACASAVCALCVRLRQLPFDRRTTASSTARRFAKHETRAHACETRRERRRECRAQECCRLDSR